jgi:hypothetical protein
VMMRKSVVAALGGYDPSSGDIVSDYDLWLRIGRVARIANVPTPLYRWTRSAASLSMSDRQLAINQTFALRDREFPRLLARGQARAIYTSIHPADFYPSRREYFVKKSTMFRSLAYLYRRDGRRLSSLFAQLAATLHDPRDRRNLRNLALMLRDTSDTPLWEYEFV